MVPFPQNCICFPGAACASIDRMEPSPLYRQLAVHYLDAIRAGTLTPGDKLPSLRSLMRLHGISLSTALQLCRTMEGEGWVEARDRSGYFVKRPRRLAIAAMEEPAANVAPDPAQYLGQSGHRVDRVLATLR